MADKLIQPIQPRQPIQEPIQPIQQIQEPIQPIQPLQPIQPSRYSNLNDITNPFHLETSDNPWIVLETKLLSIKNYSRWSPSMQQAL